MRADGPVRDQPLPGDDQGDVPQVDPVGGVGQVAHPGPLLRHDPAEQPHQAEAHQPGKSDLQQRGYAVHPCRRRIQAEGFGVGEGQARREDQQGRQQGDGPPPAHRNVAPVEEDAEQEEGAVVPEHGRIGQYAEGRVGAEDVPHEVLGRQGQRNEQPPQGMAELQAQPGDGGERRRHQQQVPEKPEVVEPAHPVRQRPGGPGAPAGKLLPGMVGGEGVHPVGGRDDGEHAHQQGQADPPEAVPAQRLQPPPLPQHCGEEAAEHEEHRHPEPVNEQQDVDVGIGGGVGGVRVSDLYRPALRGHQEQGAMQQYAQKHGKGPQHVQVMESGHGA